MMSTETKVHPFQGYTIRVKNADVLDTIEGMFYNAYTHGQEPAMVIDYSAEDCKVEDVAKLNQLLGVKAPDGLLLLHV